jgi:hypothetical protein
VSYEVTATLLQGDHAALMGTSDNWAQVDLSLRSTGMHAVGSRPVLTLNSSGPADDLQAVELCPGAWNRLSGQAPGALARGQCYRGLRPFEIEAE